MTDKVIKDKKVFIYELQCKLIKNDEMFTIKGSLDKRK